MADEKPVLYPTKTRLGTARAIRMGVVRHWHFGNPETWDLISGRLLTARVAEFVRANLAEIPAPVEFNTSVVRLTPDGENWLTKYGSTDE